MNKFKYESYIRACNLLTVGHQQFKWISAGYAFYSATIHVYTVPWPASGWSPWVHLHCSSFRYCLYRSCVSSWPWRPHNGHGSCLRYFSREWSATSTLTLTWTWRSCCGYAMWCVWRRSYDDAASPGWICRWLPMMTGLRSRPRVLRSW